MSWLGLFNFAVLQWFGVRLAKVINRPDLVGAAQRQGIGRVERWKLLRWIWPLTGWWSDFRWIARRPRTLGARLLDAAQFGGATVSLADVIESEPIHAWFELSYSSYLVIQRTLLQSMPQEWQARFVAMLEELDDAYGDQVPALTYQVRAKRDGKYVQDPLADYRRGRRILPRTIRADEVTP